MDVVCLPPEGTALKPKSESEAREAVCNLVRQGTLRGILRTRRISTTEQFLILADTKCVGHKSVLLPGVHKSEDGTHQ